MATTQIGAQLPVEWADAIEELIRRENDRARAAGRKPTANKNSITIALWGAKLKRAGLLPAQKER